MRVPDSVAFAYEEALAVAEPLRQLAASRLRIVCARNNWLFDDRMKSDESCLSKLEAGHGPLGSLHDLYATTVVVPTQNELEKAVDEVLKQFDGDVKVARTRSAEEFVYDDIHILARLGTQVSPAAVSAPVRNRTFEIQIRTGLQYAWWRATHDQIYKSSRDEALGWGVQRVSSQAKASLELLDSILADLPAAGRAQRPAPAHEVATTSSVNWLELWAPEFRPKDQLRFFKTTSLLTSNCAISTEQLARSLESDPISALVEQPELTPGQVILAAAHRIVGPEMDEMLLTSGEKVLVTEELAVAYPEILSLTDDVTVRA